MDVRAIFAASKACFTTDFGLLLLRVSFGLSLFLKHGLEKITGFGRMVPGFLTRFTSVRP